MNFANKVKNKNRGGIFEATVRFMVCELSKLTLCGCVLKSSNWRNQLHKAITVFGWC